MKRQLLLLIIAIIALIATACSSNETSKETSTDNAKKTEKVEEIVVKHQFGETKVKQNPEKVVVFDFGTLDTLDALGVEVAGLPKDYVPTYLSKYKDDKYANLGAAKEPDFEKINELQPDLIIIAGRQQELYDKFAEIAPTVYMAVDTTKYMESFKENVTTLGKIFDKENEVKAEVEKIEKSVAALNEKGSKLNKKALIILANDGKVSAYGKNSRFGIIHDEFGISPVDESIEVSTHGQSISFEYIAEKNPDYLFVVDRGAVVVGGESSAKQIVENSLVKKTNAVKNGKVIYLDANYWYTSGGGLVSVAEMVKEVEAAIK
ncbi:siderophore ABC transporter substrate-binding protein [Bacillus marasmi]|uniref:siderophore ABC transporter substrate-binding protein n=1 Tax=Bacillus marasmi TaxID=1926279 RepID=UPI0011C91EA4|nr:siderophore ABC transporter substrate-binding protein [Bacillus marasmi]